MDDAYNPQQQQQQNQEQQQQQQQKQQQQQQSLPMSSPDPAAADHNNNNHQQQQTLLSHESTISEEDGGDRLHRRRTLYLIRHGEALHNVLEAQAEQAAKIEAERLHLSPEETRQRMEEARQSVLTDPSLRDAPLTEKGKEQARQVSKQLQAIMENGGKIHPPTEAMCSPLTRCLQTTKIVLQHSTITIRAHVRPELAERQTQFPPDTPRPLGDLLRVTSNDDRFLIDHAERLPPATAEHEAVVRETKEMLRERANQLFDLLMDVTTQHRHVLVVSHKGFLRELERGLLQIPDSPLFGNAELRVYRVVFTRGDRSLHHVERLH
jgi:broad specificity phosphatase PhoE